jgi:hypothetical protein
MLTFLADSDNAKLKEDAEIPDFLEEYKETGVFQVSQYEEVAHAVVLLREDQDAEYLRA